MPDAQPHPFDTAVALEPAREHEWRGHTSPAYANFIGPYGGITAAQMINGVMQHPQRLGEPVSFTVNFAAAVADGEFIVRARPARTNRSTQHWIVEILQNGETMATATALTAVRRDTWSGHEAVMPQVPRPQDVPRTPRRGVEWINRYAMHFFEGFIPRQWEGQGDDVSLTRLWTRDDPPRPLDFASLTAMSDTFFPRIWLRRAKQTPLGTVTMTVYYHADSAVLGKTGTDFLLGQAQGNGFRNGYFDHSGFLWNEAGELLVTTHQLMYFKE
ncbi:acyl-CoA thioesterase [Ramlibacter albus]|uniref:Thioesterase family protein n=1 Tax=Ramlibacter albus TaxID=2079448 RepID=A0A923M671_9BURK|nr:thioesterase family protein [Ramlibacter albus]MBC5764700.1 thioesterase family protein [Ramlibacter albus]